MRSFFKAAVCLLVFFSLLASSISVYANQEDSEPPQLESVKINSSKLKVGDKLIITAIIKDDISGVGNVNITFRSSSNKILNFPLDYNKETQEWYQIRTIASNTEPGLWKFDNMIISDKSNNIVKITPDSLDANTSIDFTVENSDGDWTSPAIKQLEISKKKVEVGEEIIFKAHITDDKSGIEFAHINYQAPNYNITNKRLTINLEFDPIQNIWIGKHIVSNEDINGTWEFNSIYVLDKNENASSQFRDFYPENELDFMVVSDKIIDVTNTANIHSINTNGSREEMILQLVMDEDIKAKLKGSVTGEIALEDRQGKTLNIKIEAIDKYWACDVKFLLPIDINDGEWYVKQITLGDYDSQYSFINFSGFSVTEFYVPSKEADKWVRTNLAEKVNRINGELRDYINVIANGYYQINEFIKKFKQALPPFTVDVTYEGLLEFANKGGPNGDEYFLYDWWKEGLITNPEPPPVPIMIYNTTTHWENNNISFLEHQDVEWNIADVLHLIPELNSSNSKVIAYITSPTGKEYKIKSFKYDPEFSRFDTAYKKGGWTGTFELPNKPLEGTWTLNKLEVKNDGRKLTFLNGRDFYGATFNLVDAYDIPKKTIPDNKKN